MELKIAESLLWSINPVLIRQRQLLYEIQSIRSHLLQSAEPKEVDEFFEVCEKLAHSTPAPYVGLIQWGWKVTTPHDDTIKLNDVMKLFKTLEDIPYPHWELVVDLFNFAMYQ